jgi:PWWP domain
METLTTMTEVPQAPAPTVEHHYVPGTLVWCKYPGFPWWPARVEDPAYLPDDFTQDRSSDDEIAVFFFGEHTYEWLLSFLSRIVSSELTIKPYSSPQWPVEDKDLKNAVEELETPASWYDQLLDFAASKSENERPPNNSARPKRSTKRQPKVFEAYKSPQEAVSESTGKQPSHLLLKRRRQRLKPQIMRQPLKTIICRSKITRSVSWSLRRNDKREKESTRFGPRS